MKIKILKTFNLAFALFTWILALAMDFVFFASLSVKIALFRIGGMLRDTSLGKMSWIRKPLSAKPISSGKRWFNRPDCSAMALSEMDPGYNLLTKLSFYCIGATPTNSLNEFIPL